MHSDLKDIHFTPTQLAFINTLSDGLNHKREELLSLCGPCSKSSLKVQICLLRKKLRPVGHDILPIYVHPNTTQYRHVISISNKLSPNP